MVLNVRMKVDIIYLKIIKLLEIYVVYMYIYKLLVKMI